ncbi:hypothetical protein PA10_00262 [Pseudomonas phage pPa_SNUABM_DT01]|nr:hypothetical protein PA10_00262 [Pseudomonas phage pPa_SNUABM_DT01]
MTLTASILNYTSKVKAKIDKIIADKDIIGTDNVRGSIYRNIFKGFIRTVSTQEGGPSVSGDFPAVGTPFADNLNIYLHFRIPYNINVDSKMFWLNIRGYCFGGSQIIGTTAVGYSYAPTKQLLNTQVSSVQTAELYADTNGNVVLSILFPSIYYVTLEIDSMMVGNGTPIKRDMLQVKYSKSNRVVF